MTIASDLLEKHLQTLVADNARWQTLIAEEVVWELPYAVALGHPSKLSGREEVMRHANWFVGAVKVFRFFDVRLYALVDANAAIAEVKAEGVIKATGRIYRQEYVVLLRAVGGKIALLREYFDPTRASYAMETPLLGLNSPAEPGIISNEHQ
jgi:ketosteroid isomerase-like protein